jgi:hypothetical protein
MAKRKRRGLGSSEAIHTKKMAEASEEIGYMVALVTNKARNGRCGAASNAYGSMMTAYGQYLAHQGAGGRASAPSHAALIRKAATEFNSACLVNVNYTMTGRKRRRKARRR